MFQDLITYFETLDQHPVQRLVFLVSGMLLLWMLEGGIPLIALRYRKNKFNHAAVNFSFTLIHLVIHTGFAVLIIFCSDWGRNLNIGLANWMNANIIWSIVITILILDFFGGWLVHFTEHKIKWMWRFHIIHHADTKVDVTTGLRHHPVESVLRGLFFLAGVLVAGAPMFAVMIFQTLLVLSTQFTHANISLPKWIDRSLSWVLVSPNMHKVHHHFKQPYTDSNYGAVFSVWDRLLGTFMKLDPGKIVYGLDRYYPSAKDEDFKTLVTFPFKADFFSSDKEPVNDEKQNRQAEHTVWDII